MDYDTTFGNKIQVSDPTDACFLFLNGIPTGIRKDWMAKIRLF